MSESSPSSGYWLDRAVAEIIKTYPEGKIVVSSGISPSATYHVGHLREIMTAEAIAWGIRQSGRQALHVHVVDNFDPLRRRYDFLPVAYEQYVGWPVCLVPDPFDGCRARHQTYAEHYYQEFAGYIKQLGIDGPHFQVKRSYEDLYQPGLMAPQIERTLKRNDQVREIFQETSQRELPADWTPVLLVGENNMLRTGKLSQWDQKQQTIEGISYADGHAKLNWRLDWPARWQVLQVRVEPFSAQEHGAAGGSYDTGVRFSREIFAAEPPIAAVQYANIHLPGDTKKMSSSRGNLVTPAQALEIMPAELLRYFIVRSRPERTLYWNTGVTLYNLLDEFAEVQAAVQAGQPHAFAEAYAFAVDGRKEDSDTAVISSIPFSHLVSTYQAAGGDQAATLEILERTGYAEAVQRERAVVTAELDYVERWLAKYAPEEVKFTVQSQLPSVELSSEQETFLDHLATKLESQTDLSGQAMHDLIYAVLQEEGLKPNQAFVALYRVILGREAGPKAGWFLASLEHDWLVRRLRRQG